MKMLIAPILIAVSLAPAIAQDENPLVRASREYEARRAGPNQNAGPTYIGAVEALIGTRRVPLEKQNGVVQAKMGVLSMSTFTTFSGAKSPVRFRSGEPLLFVSRVQSLDYDPSSDYALMKIESRKNDRRAYSSAAGLGGKQSQIRQIPISVEPYGKAFVRITPAQPLVPGEYLISGYLFGVD